MKLKQIIISTLAVLFVFPLVATFAYQANTSSIEVITTFDFPGTGNNTLPQKINDNGLIVGIVVDAAGVSRGFLRARSGNFSDAFVEPNDTGGVTNGRGINNAKVVVGEYLNGTDGTFHGYRL